MDKITEQRIILLHPDLRDEVTNLVNLANELLTGSAQVRIVQGLRTFAEQNRLYSLGRTVVNPDGKSTRKPKGNIVTNAKGGQSIHNYGCAIDFTLLINGKEISWDINKDFDNDRIADWKEVVNLFKKAGWSWGGDWKSFKDYPHLEKSQGYTWRELLEKHNNGEVDEEGYVIF